MKHIRTLTAATAAIAVLSCAQVFAQDGWKQENGKSYYIQNEQQLSNQWFSLERTVQYKQTKPSDQLRADAVVTDWYYASADGSVLKNGWFQLGGAYYYFSGSGVNTRSNWVNIGDARYYVDETGARKQNGWFSIESVNGKGETTVSWYYAQPDGVIYRNGWYTIDGKDYYFDGGGRSARKTWVNLDGARYYVDEAGVQQRGWFSISGVNANGTSYENWYHAEDNGVLSRGAWYQLDGKWYYFDANGLSYRARWYVDQKTKKRYYMNADGVNEQNGWFAITGTNAKGETYKNWYYADADGSVKTNGYYELDGKLYGFDGNGLMYQSRWIAKTDKLYYYANANGVITRGGWFNAETKDADGNAVANWYYADAQGLVHRTDDSHWETINGKRYYLSAAGRMTTGWVLDKKVYLKEDGTFATGWQYLPIPESWMDDSDYVRDYVREHGDSAWFYFDASNGRKKMADSGLQVLEVEGKQYGFDSYGFLQTGWTKMKSKSPEISGYSYFEETSAAQNETGESKTNNKLSGTVLKRTWKLLYAPADVGAELTQGWYYFGGDGYPYAASSGKEYEVRRINGKNYLFDQYGMARSGLVELNGEFYYFGRGAKHLEGAGKGRTVINDGDDAHAVYYFDSQSKGVTGVQDGYYYYKGKLQKADAKSKYEVFDVPGLGLRLINASGKVMKNQKLKDGSDQTWKVAADGSIIVFGSNEVQENVSPTEQLDMD